ncbi:MAG: zf-HC2 domain-containing protein [Planctomycetes bacterium]|nr:zf-HC2 domain-containing protein [Planctomycetota bacterium]
MLSCKDVTELISQSQDRKLPWYQRLRVRLHVLMCRSCSYFRRQMLLLRDALRHLRGTAEDEDVTSGPPLSQEARERIKRAITRGEP